MGVWRHVGAGVAYSRSSRRNTEPPQPKYPRTLRVCIFSTSSRPQWLGEHTSEIALTPQRAGTAILPFSSQMQCSCSVKKVYPPVALFPVSLRFYWSIWKINNKEICRWRLKSWTYNLEGKIPANSDLKALEWRSNVCECSSRACVTIRPHVRHGALQFRLCFIVTASNKATPSWVTGPGRATPQKSCGHCVNTSTALRNWLSLITLGFFFFFFGLNSHTPPPLSSVASKIHMSVILLSTSDLTCLLPEPQKTTHLTSTRLPNLLQILDHYASYAAGSLSQNALCLGILLKYFPRTRIINHHLELSWGVTDPRDQKKSHRCKSSHSKEEKSPYLCFAEIPCDIILQTWEG